MKTKTVSAHKPSTKRETGQHHFADCGGLPRCVTCGADEDDAYVGGQECTYWVVDDSDEGVAAYLGQDKHTPGPWNTGSTMTRVEVWPEGWNAPMCIADCHTKHAPESEAERVANARLVAAAPELIHAAKLAYAELAKMGCECDCENLPTSCPVCACKAAIARAEGGAS